MRNGNAVRSSTFCPKEQVNERDQRRELNQVHVKSSWLSSVYFPIAFYYNKHLSLKKKNKKKKTRNPESCFQNLE